jgi:UDP-N-acetylglucosamine 2-epimerase (non-hydrolysing)
MHIVHIAGARPNFPKLAPVHRAIRDAAWRQTIVHTGQHYDEAMSGAFFDDLEIPAPEVNLEVGSASHAVQTARIMERVEPVLTAQNPDWVLVYGDVNSTVAAALVASKLGIRVAHVEAGLRSYDRTMPEEINRIVTDRLANLLLTPSRDASETLRAEGEPEDEIEFVGNVMIDTLLRTLPAARASGFRQSLALPNDPIVVTLHRPSNVDDPQRLRAVAGALSTLADHRPVVFPVHPRTRQRLDSAGIDAGRVQLLDPISYLAMLDLVQGAHAVVTDSGGLQEETTALGVPCFTLRPNTERPVTVIEGTNTLVPDPADLASHVKALNNGRRQARIPDGWDGRAAERIALALAKRKPAAASSRS